MCGDTWYLFPQHPSQSGLGGAGSVWGAVNGDTPAGGGFCITVVTTCEEAANGSSSIMTTVHDAAHNDITNGVLIPGTGGVNVHDSAEVTASPGIPASSTVDFYYYSPASACETPASGTPVETTTLTRCTETNAGDGCMETTDMTTSVNIPSPSTLVGCKVVGAFQAVFSGGTVDSTDIPPATSECEEVKVCSSITGYSYTTGAQSGNCVLEEKVAGVCPDGTTEATVTVNITNTYLVSVQATVPAGSIDKIQGGLAAKASYQNPSTLAANSAHFTCSDSTSGDVAVNLSKAKTTGGNTGNVITWNIDNSAGASALTCTLQVNVTKKFSTCGEQPITSSWSEVLDGVKSPYTGQLSVNVTGC